MTRLDAISHKVTGGARLSLEEGLWLYKQADLEDLGSLANRVREHRHGNLTYYNRNLHLNYTNICEAACGFCAFHENTATSPGAFALTVGECLSYIREHFEEGMTEIHIVGGLNPGLPLSFYLDLVRGIHLHYPQLHIKAFSAVEIHFMAKKAGLSHRTILKQLISAGLGSLPGGGAEIFSPRVRSRICPHKVDAAGWLSIHESAHALGLPTNSTMLFGAIESLEERVGHMLMLRSLQDRTRGFQAFVPLAYQPGRGLPEIKEPPTEEDVLRTIAVSRLLLDNISHIKAYWVTTGLALAAALQNWGADDIDGTLVEERVCHSAGAPSPCSTSPEELKRIIRSAGREPAERTSIYHLLGYPPQSEQVHGFARKQQI